MNTTPDCSPIASIVSRLVTEFRGKLAKTILAPFTPSSGVGRRLGGNEYLWFDLSRLIVEKLKRASKRHDALHNLLRHTPAVERIVTFTEHLPKVCEKYLTRLGDEQALAIRSRCQRVDGRWQQIPMMDFACDVRPRHLDLLKEVFANEEWRRKYCPGVILQSGNSYHFYGFKLLTQVQWVEFLGRCLLLSPYCDSRFIAHCLVAGACQLRISVDSTRHEPPHVVAELPG